MEKRENVFSRLQEPVLVVPGSKEAMLVYDEFHHALGESEWVARGGMQSKYYFNIDNIFNQVKKLVVNDGGTIS